MQLSKNFTRAEFEASQTAARYGESNFIPEELLGRARWVAEQMEKVRKILGENPITISSAYRSPEVNALVGGSKTSDHCRMYAVDFICPRFGTPREIVEAIIKSDLEFGQVIFEGTWVHLSFNTSKHRRQALTAHFSPKGVTYTPFA